LDKLGLPSAPLETDSIVKKCSHNDNNEHIWIKKIRISASGIWPGKLAFQTFSRISAVHETKNYVLIII
jgi:hypothetical protein